MHNRFRWKKFSWKLMFITKDLECTCIIDKLLEYYNYIDIFFLKFSFEILQIILILITRRQNIFKLQIRFNINWSFLIINREYKSFIEIDFRKRNHLRTKRLSSSIPLVYPRMKNAAIKRRRAVKLKPEFNRLS